MNHALPPSNTLNHAAAPHHPPNFDRIARAYRWLEYLSLGTLLERVRCFHLDAERLGDRRRALILGDGDGRFSARLLAANAELHATAVDLSPVMLQLLQNRCAAAASRLTCIHQDARTCTPPLPPDLVVTHFFLDCLTQPEVDALVSRLLPLLADDALWLVSEFRIPQGWLKWPAKLYVRTLYLAFRLLTGLQVTALPDHARTLRAFGFEIVAECQFLCGLLTSQMWQAQPPQKVGAPT